MTPSSRMSPGRAQLGVSLMFFTNGALFSALLPRYPEVKAAYGLSDAAFGLLVICYPVGSILAGATAAPLIRRFGARTITAVGTTLLAAMLALALSSPTPWGFGAVLLVGGALDAIIDSAQNVQGVVVEQWRGRSIINSLHAIWSLGATVGGLIGTWGAANHIDLQLQMVVNGIVWAVVAVLAAVLAAAPAVTTQPTSVDAGEPADTAQAASSRPAGARVWKLLIPLALLAIAGTLMEEVASSWSALFMVTETNAPAALTGLGYTVMLASQFVGRLLGDPMTDRWGSAAVARSGGAVITVGVLLVIFGPNYLVTLVGFACMGFGCATLVPAAFAAAARIPGLPHGTGIAVIGWIMRLGFVTTSPIIGAISQATSLRVAMVLPLAGGIAAFVVAHGLVRRRAVRAEAA